MLRDITIENYRLFEKFHMEGLTQINLFVGTNNSGKSSLLEAIYLLVNNEDPSALLEILYNRGQFVSESPHFAEGISSGDLLFELVEAFRGRELRKDQKIIVTSQKDDGISLEYGFVDSETSWPGKIEGRVYALIEGVGSAFRDEGATEAYYFFPFERDNSSLSKGPAGARRIDKSKINKHFLTTVHLDKQTILNLWDRIVLTPKEDMVTEALGILELNLERVAFLGNQTTPQRSILFKIKENSVPLPLGSMGDGMYRILALAMSLVNCENGAIFVDEIDTGLHYKALVKVWRLVIETAKRLNIQIFATTHSWDCLVAFHKALSEAEEIALGSVFRLERKNGQIDYVAYTGEELAVAVKHDIEMR